MQARILIARFPGMMPGGAEHPAVTDWLVDTVLKAKGDPRIGAIRFLRLNDVPITMTRNRMCLAAKQLGVDLVMMVDSDMHPDVELGHLPEAKPFWETAMDLAWNHKGPCFIAAPYCGPPPFENVYMFQWTNKETDSPGPDFHLSQFSREEAEKKRGIEEVAAAPTGLCMFHTECLDKLVHPYFYYEWTDETQSQKASTEDCTFTRDLSLQRVPVYSLWDCWAGHYKVKCVRKPRCLTPEIMSKQFMDVVKKYPDLPPQIPLSQRTPVIARRPSDEPIISDDLLNKPVAEIRELVCQS